MSDDASPDTPRDTSPDTSPDASPDAPRDTSRDPKAVSDADWQETLSPQAYRVLRHEATERPGSSRLNDEWRRGTYVCAACGHPLFRSDVKFDAHCGWPSFAEALPGAFETSTDHHVGYPRTEYHCASCGGHHGHVFEDGPDPTGLRYCSNGVALRFVPEGDQTG